MNIYDELEWRGLVNQVSDADAVRKYLEEPGRYMYCGFDPTAESLHIGNLVPLLCLVRMLKAGHNPLFLLGGATGRIGDPSGKDKERELSNSNLLEERLEMIKAQISAFVERNTGKKAEVVNNYDWMKEISAIGLLRDIGKFFTVNWMMQKESVKGRIGREGTGISYTEFSYMLLQSHDFYHLLKEKDCHLQIGGGDQWGNITSGCEYIRKRSAAEGTETEAFALTFPLITTASGKKFGKSEKGAIFMNPEITRPYTFYQYWLNTDDRDVVNFLKYFTFKTQEEIAELEKALEERPHMREAQKALAAAVTIMVHGEEVLAEVEKATAALFGKGDLKEIAPDTLRSAFESAPSVSYAADGLPDLPQVLVDLNMCKSKGQARKDIKAGGVYINGDRAAEDYTPATEDFIGGELLVIRKGKKNYGLLTLD
ncbi:MAG: tyrosine--tRNA ligase [Desulfovibrio sp.]